MAEEYTSPESYQYEAPPAEKKSNKTLIIVLIVVAVLLLCCCCALLAGLIWYLSSQGYVSQLLPQMLSLL